MTCLHWLLSLLSPAVASDDRLNTDCARCLWAALWTGEVEWCEPCHKEMRRGYQSHPFRKGAF